MRSQFQRGAREEAIGQIVERIASVPGVEVLDGSDAIADWPLLTRS